MIRSFAFTTQGRLHSKNIEMFLMPTLLADTNLFLWVDLEQPTPEETKFVLEDIFQERKRTHFRFKVRLLNQREETLLEGYHVYRLVTGEKPVRNP